MSNFLDNMHVHITHWLQWWLGILIQIYKVIYLYRLIVCQFSAQFSNPVKSARVFRGSLNLNANQFKWHYCFMLNCIKVARSCLLKLNLMILSFSIPDTRFICSFLVPHIHSNNCCHLKLEFTILMVNDNNIGW